MTVENQKLKEVYLYFYTDSVGLPRLIDQSPDITWPFVLKDLLERHSGVKVYLYFRGLGGGRITEIEQIYNRDLGYFRSQGDGSFSFAIFNVGVVDAAPRPFTYHLKKLGFIPFVGKRIWFLLAGRLHKHRRILQRIYSFRLTSPKKFKNSFDRMIDGMRKKGIVSISINTPSTPLELENRSPGLRHSIALYNSLKQSKAGVIHVSTDWIIDEHYLDCGHHLNEMGHKELAQKLYLHINGVING